MSAMKASGEDDMAYFERRYQERVTSLMSFTTGMIFFLKIKINLIVIKACSHGATATVVFLVATISLYEI